MTDLNEQKTALRVGLTYNLKKSNSDTEAEFDEISTIEAIGNALEEGGNTIEYIEVGENPIQKLLDNPPDIVFNIAEGSFGRGREAHLPAILSFLGIPFTASDETTMCISLDKHIAKIITSSSGIRTPNWIVTDTSESESLNALKFPVIVKPNAEGSSKGISTESIAVNKEKLKEILTEQIRRYSGEFLIEEYIAGREFTVGILGNGNDIRVFEPMEIVFKDKEHRVYGYEVKKDFRKYVDYTINANIPINVIYEIKAKAAEIFKVFGCKDIARIDFRVADDLSVYFIEVNPLPGLAPGYSDFPMLAEFGGISYSELINSILTTAKKRYSLSTKQQSRSENE